MMSRYGICPDCGSHIPEYRFDDTWVLCECGWMSSKNTDKQEKSLQKKATLRIVFVALLMMVTFLHTAHWGSESLNVIPLQAQLLINTDTPKTLHSYAQICLKRHKLECAEAYTSQWAEKVQSQHAWEELALLRVKMDLKRPAIQAFEKYTALQGDKPLALFHYAKALEGIENTEKAERIYRHLVQVDKEIYPRTVVEELVRMLVSDNRLQEANDILEQLSKPNMELPAHLVRQKEWIKDLLEEQNEISSSASL